MMECFNREYGFDYPWAKYDQITIRGIGGGAESTGATVVGQSTIDDDRAEQDFPSPPGSEVEAMRSPRDHVARAAGEALANFPN